MKSILRSLTAQGHIYRSGRSAVSRQSRNFCSSADSITYDDIESAIRKWKIVRPVVGLALGVAVGYLMCGGRASEMREHRLKVLKEADEFYKWSEKTWRRLQKMGNDVV